MSETNLFNLSDDGLGICECDLHPNHNTIPSFRNYCVSKDGKILSHFKGKGQLKWQPKDKNEQHTYYRIRILRDDGVHKWVSRHIVLLSSYKGFDQNPDRRYVNHINCVPGDDDLSNLEWCTHEENMNHAWCNDRMESIYQPLDVLNIETNVTTRYKTISDFIRTVDVNPRTVYERLTTDNAIVYEGKYRYKRAEDEWSTTPLEDFKHQYKYLGRELLVLNLRNHTVKKYNTIFSAANHLGIRPSHIANNCLKKLNTPCNGYIFRYSGEEIWPVFDYLQCQLLKQQNYPQTMLPGCAFFDDNGRCVFIGTYEDASQRFNLSAGTIRNSVCAGNIVCGYKTVAIRKYGACEVSDACKNIHP